MAEWITLAAAAEASNYSPCGLARLLDAGKIPPEHVKRVGKLRYINAAAVPLLIGLKARWHDTWIVQQPDNAIHIPDPNGEYLGFVLTPDEAARLATIRVLHRLYPTTQERNEAMRGDG